ncbi:tyrosine-type recombinase/integrase [Aedoeadaptatus coxii]|uniref:tyrosine-type recombinase/integrase n=1 Tax=Aedoeadaptatus coxii TaxID=755172 RepID=UPI002AD2CBFE|nr:tyrosine-type recombinase/integrase [Peptoniphilus coxii]
MSWKKIGKGKYKLDVERQVNGERKRKTKTYNTELKGRDLNRFMQARENEAYDLLGESDDIIDYSEITYRQFVDIFLSHIDVEARTVHFYKDFLQGRTMERFGNKKIKAIKKADIVDYIKHLKKTPSKTTGKPLSPKTIKHYRDCLRALFNYAEDLKIISETPVHNIKINPVPNQVQGRYYEPDQLDQVMEALQEKGDFKYYVFFVLQLYTGCRPSEIYGLTWNKIDFDRSMITIDQALVLSRESVGYVLKPTKTCDTRTKPLPGSLLQLLERLKSESLGVTDYVFTNSKGDHLVQDAFRKYLKKFCAKHDLPYIPPYGIRHTTGTILAAKGIPVANVAKQLGHASTQTTSKYIHATRSVDEEAENILADTVRPKMRIVK